MSKDIVNVQAGENLSARQYHAVNVSGTLAASTEVAYGILQNKPDASGEDAAVAIHGKTFYRAGGGAHTDGAMLTATTSGWLNVADSGDQTCGRALSAVASGGIGQGFVNFAQAGYLAT